MYSLENRRTLLDVARKSVEYGVNQSRRLLVDLDAYPEGLRENRGTFVTLERQGRLRGCIGSLTSRCPLVQDVAENAYGAAFRDTRFSPMTADELDGLDIHISILSESERIDFTNERDLLRKLRPGVDGLILLDGLRRGTFLPAVWENLPNPADFLNHLKYKAGLAADYWSDTLEVFRYTTEVFPERI